MRVRKLLGILVVGGLFLVAVPAWAQFRANSVAISGFAGINIADLGNTIEAAAANVDNVRTAPSLNLAVEYVTASPWIGIEFGGNFTPASIQLIAPIATPDINFQFNHWYLTGNAVFHILPDRSVVPYLTAGAGIVILDPELGDSQTKFVFNGGGGVDIFGVRTERTSVALRLDGRFYLYSLRAADLDAATVAELGLPAGFDRTLSDLVLSAGLRVTL